MPRVAPPPIAGRPSAVSAASYSREGRRHLRQAMLAYPDSKPIEALVTYQEAVDTVLRWRTVNRYKCDLDHILEALLRQAGRSEEFEALSERLHAALERRRGRPDEPRASAKKVKDATEREAAEAFAELKRRALKYNNMNAAAAALYTLVVSHAGMRPVELVGARLDGTLLRLRQAKATARHRPSREIELAELPPVVIEAVRALIFLAPKASSYAAFSYWRNAVREMLGRACVRVNVRKLSLYSFRDVAIATWERAGFSVAEIAALAGHLSLATARANYARGNVGWKRKALPRPVATIDAAVVATRSEAAGTKDDAAAGADEPVEAVPTEAEREVAQWSRQTP